MTTIAIILAAGQGKRMQAGYNKVLMTLGGKPMLEHTLDVFQASPLVDGIILVAKDTELEYLSDFFSAETHSKIIKSVAGGAERQDSVYQGLLALPESCTHVLIHDGARPFVSLEVIERVVEAITAEAGAVAGVPVKDTVKVINEDNFVEKTLNRAELWNIQTPQGFVRNQVLEAYQQAMLEKYYGTDDASLVEYYGGKVKVVLGAYENIKVTTPEDIVIGEALLRQGSDVHEYMK
ncbi:MAG: 2-C-methyl-D-erythritol 4-phosphate cytidylyltransferase [Peptococcaceae bacterium]|nr:2-C-methyl-D-erythritol 4-phosphate cytidylyltransferase [Peptococcaceae bacterium]